MHIPDGYLGPQTWIASYAVMGPLWAVASSRVRKTLGRREMPTLALSSAFAFIVMMFNVPAPGGTTGHAVGSVLVAVLLGPWAAVWAISAALAIQALLFGDGGLTALAANCFNMAFVMPFAGYMVYRVLAGNSPAGSRRRAFSAAAGGYVGLNAAALCAAIQFGIQPIIATDAAGRPLYCPFGLGIAVPAMMIEHLLLFGFVEAAVTGMAVAYLGRTEPWLVVPEKVAGAIKSATRRPVLALVILVILTPIGLLLPAFFGGGAAWGEWGAEEIRAMAGYIPKGMAALGEMWHSLLPDYGPADADGSPALAQALWYIFSAAFGAAVIWLAFSILSGKRPPAGNPDDSSDAALWKDLRGEQLRAQRDSSREKLRRKPQNDEEDA